VNDKIPTWNFLKEFANLVRENAYTVYIGDKFDTSVIVVSIAFSALYAHPHPERLLLGHSPVRSYHVYLVLPSKDDGVIAAPLHVLRDSFSFRAVLAKLILKVATDDPHFSVLSVQSNESAIGGNTNIPERSILKLAIFGV